MLVKKYSNRRLYDTDASRYITLEELTELVRGGADVRVIDAKTNEDLTQATLLQIVLETRAARLLPVPLLARLVRMQDDALADFFSRWVSQALDLYLQVKQGAQAVSPYFPLANLPFSAGNAMARMLQGQAFWPEPPGYGPPAYPPAAPPPPPRPAPPPPASTGGETESALAAMRLELESLKRAIAKPARTPARAAKKKKRP